MRSRSLVVLLAVLVAAGATTATLVGRGQRDGLALRSVAGKESGLTFLPPPPDPAFEVPPPQLLRANAAVSRWAPVLLAVDARARPDADSRRVASLRRRTPEGTTNLLLIVGQSKDSKGRLWARVRLPILPNGSTGWVPRRALGGYRFVRTRLVVDLERLEVQLLREGKTIFRAPVGIGRSDSPTPTGEFYVRNKLTKFRSPRYGPVAFGTSARSSVLTDWPADGFIGIHGTNEPDLLPGRISHGCIRLRNEDIVRLAELLPVGTPITIR